MSQAVAEILCEALDFSQAVVDRENFVIQGVKLSGRKSRNRRGKRGIVYSDQAIQQTVQLFESCPVTVRGGHDRARRDYHSQNGQLRNGRVKDLGSDKAASYFDWHLNSADELTPKLLEDAEKFPQNCPLSQEVMEWQESINDDGDVLIESLTDDPLKIGVAVVYRGGLNRSLFESLEDEDMEIKTKEELKARYKTLCEELEECACAAVSTSKEDLKAKLESAIAEREAALAKVKELESQLEEYKNEETRLEHVEVITKAARELIAESYEVSAELMEDLLGMWDGESYKRVLTEIGKHYHPSPEGEADPGPTSKSGARSSRVTQATGRSRVGIHNRR